jgi:D-alanyl-D-alanine carboxypeptidase (penicillin-binding protein 5/6)
VPVQTPLRHAIRPLLTVLAALAMAGAVAVPVYASATTPNAAKALAARHDAGTPTATATPTATPIATPTPIPGPSGLRIKGGALANASTGKILWSEDLNTERPIGSIVKVMTALVVIRTGDLGRTITVPKSVIAYLKKQDQPSTAGLLPGDKLTARQLLEALLLPSGCDAAYTLAEAYGPGLNAFIAKMNAEAKKLGLTNTYFSNFDGLPWPSEHSTWSTPANLITLGRYAMRYTVLRAIVGQRTYSVAGTTPTSGRTPTR